MTEKSPDHTATFEHPKDRYLVKLENTIVADSTNVILLKENVKADVALPDIPYFPIGDIKQDLLTGTDHHTFCPLKGDASYYTLTLDGNTVENSVWYYPEPLEYVAEIDGHVAFYADKFEIVMERNVSQEILAGYAALQGG